MFRDVVGFAVSLRLARLLSPSEYGLFGLMNSVMGFLSLFSARTFISHIVQVRDGEDPAIDDQFTAGLAIQGVLAVATLGVAFALTRSATYAPVAPLVAVYSMALVWELTNDLRMRTLERDLDFRRQRSLYAAGVAVSAILSLTMAELGAGVWALVVPAMLSASPFTFDLLFGGGRRPTLRFRWSRYRPAFRFGIARLASGLVAGLRDLGQSALVVKSAGFAAQGLMGRALGIGNLATASLSSQLVGGVYPVLTRLEAGSEAFRRGAGLVLRGVAWLVVPLGGGLILAGPELVPLLYGQRWRDVTTYLAPAVVECITRSFAGTIYFILLAGNEQRKCLVQDGLVAVLVFALMGVVLRRNVVAYLWGLAAVEGLGGVLMAVWACRRRLLDYRAVGRALWAPALVVFVACATLVPAGRYLAAEGMPARLAVTATVFGLSVLVIYRIAFARDLRELLEFLPAGGTVARFLKLRPSGSGEGPAE